MSLVQRVGIGCHFCYLCALEHEAAALKLPFARTASVDRRLGRVQIDPTEATLIRSVSGTSRLCETSEPVDRTLVAGVSRQR